MSSIVNFRTTLAAGICAIAFYLVYVNQSAISAAIGQGVMIFSIWLLVMATGALIFVAVTYRDKEKDRRNRVIDGSVPLQRITTEDGGEIIVDLNKSSSGVAYLSPRYGYQEYTSPIGPDRQLEYAKAVQATRSLATMQPGDDALVRGRGKIQMNRAGIANTATGKFLAGAFDRPQKAPPAPAPVQVTQPITPPAPRLSLTDALSQSTGHKWIVGQSDSGALATFEPSVHFSAGILGSTGTAKTSSAAFTLALSALRAGWHVVTINPNGNRRPPDGGPDWYLLEDHIELHETDPALFPGQVETIYNFYQRRATLSNPRPVMIFFEEYGNLFKHLRVRSKADGDAVDLMLDTLLTQARKSRVHATFIDQEAEDWSNCVLGGTKYKMVFQMGPGRGAKVEEWKAGQLPPVGRFLVRGVEYASFHTIADLPTVLRQLPAPSSSKRIINGTATHVPMSSPASSPASPESSLQEAPPTPTASEPSEPAASAPGLPSPTDIQAQAIAYIAANPTANQTALRDHLKIAKGYANELWHLYNPAGKNYRLPTDTMDLTNDADRQQFQQMLAAGAVSFPEPKEK